MTRSESGGWQATREEKAATWNFVVLDKNKNKVLERKEWKVFRALVSASKQLRRCGKKLPRYCDVNSDQKISLSEWLECLNTTRNIPGGNSKFYLLLFVGEINLFLLQCQIQGRLLNDREKILFIRF